MGGVLNQGRKVDKAAPAAASLMVATSLWGRPIPIAYGLVRLAPNLLWYGDFRSHAHTERQGGKGGGGVKSTTYTYSAACDIALCEGPVTGIPQVWVEKKNVTPAALGLTAFLGDYGQSTWSYMSTYHPDEALGYSGLAHVVSASYDLGDSPEMPSHNFEVQARLYETAGPGGVPDAAVTQVVNDILTNANYGAGFPSAQLGSLSAMFNYCRALGIWVSPVYTEQEPAAEILERLCRIANTAPVFSEGVLKFIPYGEDAVSANGGTYTPDFPVRYALTDNDFLSDGGDPPVIVKRKPPADAYNHVQVRFRDRTKEYADNIAEAKNEQAIEMYGLRPAPVVEAPEICDPSSATMVAHLILQRYLQMNTYRFTTSAHYDLLEPMDVVTLTESTGTALTNVPVRITQIEEDEEDNLTFEAEDFLGNISTAPVYSFQQGDGYLFNYNASPGTVSAPYIFDAPGRLAETGYELWIAAAGAGDLWGGATVWVSTDGAEYRAVGDLEGPSRYGVSTATFGVGTDPDTSNTLPVNLAASKGELSSGTQADADNFTTLCIIDGELIAYQTATLNSQYNYTLGTRIRRGVFGTPIASHASGSKFARLDAALFKFPYDPSMIGKTVYFKFTSKNVWGGGVEDLADAVAYGHVIAGPIGAPADVTGFTAEAINDGILLSWDPVSTPNLMQYEIRRGNTWASAVYVGKSLTTVLRVPPVTSGTTRWLVKAVDRQGRESINATATDFSVAVPTQPGLTVQVIDNNVLLSWTDAVSSQPILTYEVRRGATWESATVIGTKTGLFTSVFELAAGTYTYWVAGIDIGGNYGTPASVSAVVNAPPDYVLKANLLSAFDGTLSNAVVHDSALYLPVDTTETYEEHFTDNSWSTPQDQVNAGYPIFIEPSAASGYYEEVYDNGTSIANGKIVVVPTQELTGSPTVTCDISVSGNGVDYTTYSGVWSVFATSFRYVKIRITATSSGGDDIVRISQLAIRVEAKLKTDAGQVAAVSTDSGGTVVTFNVPFTSVVAIDCTPQGTTAAFAVVNFAGGLNPTEFQVLLFNTSGNRISGTVNWSAKGY